MRKQQSSILPVSLVVLAFAGMLGQHTGRARDSRELIDVPGLCLTSGTWDLVNEVPSLPPLGKDYQEAYSVLSHLSGALRGINPQSTVVSCLITYLVLASFP